MTNRGSRSDGDTGYARLIGVGFSFLIIIALCVGGGVLVDRLLGTLPLFMLLGLVAGFALGLVYIYFSIRDTGSG